MRDDHPPHGYVAGRSLSTGHAFVTFEVTREGSPTVMVCKRARLVAIEHEEVRAQLLHEARVLERLAGRGAPRVGHAGADERGPFLVTERVSASALGSGRVEPLIAAARAAFAALREVHDAGVVHADLSPSNVLLSSDLARAWLVDFGLARSEDWTPPVGGAFAGTIAFAAPELARGEVIDARADLFSLAAALVSAALGREPRPVGELEPAAQLLRAGEEPLDAFAAASPIPILAACLAFEPGRRPPSAGAVLEALATW